MKVTLIGMTNSVIDGTTPDDVMFTAMSQCYNKSFDMQDALAMDSVQKEKVAKAVLSSGHHCYDAQTEVLTNRGFKNWSEISYEDELAVFSPEDCTLIGYEHPKDIIAEEYDGLMYYFNTNKVNLMVTPEHRLYCALSNTAHNRINPKFSFYKCNDIANNKTNQVVAKTPLRFISCASTTMTDMYNPFNLNQATAFNKLVGFFIGDGYADGGNRLQFHLRLQRKIDYLTNLCKELGFQINIRPHDKYDVIYPNIGHWAKTTLYDKDKNKIIPEAYFTTSRECIESLIDGLINSDGSKSNKTNNIMFSSTSYNVVSTLQALFAIVGQKWSLSQNPHGLYIMSSMLRNAQPHVNDSRTASSKVTEVQYKGMIYCASVSSGLLMVRRGENKKHIVLCGNSVSEHLNFTFLIEDASRALTHQLVRHRLASYSQRSGRYTGLEDGDWYVIPPTIAKKPEAVKLYVDTLSVVKDAYLTLTDEMDIPKEDARFLLPNGQFTNIAVTMNCRTLKNFFGERLCNRAQWEIRELAKEMATICKDKLPNVFIGSKFGYAKCEQLGYCPESKRHNCGKMKTLPELISK